MAKIIVVPQAKLSHDKDLIGLFSEALRALPTTNLNTGHRLFQAPSLLAGVGKAEVVSITFLSLDS